MEFVDLKFKDASCRIYKFGATLTEWKVGDREIIFVSPNAVFDGKKAIRGGIPICFPAFGPWAYGAQHGFARSSNWQVAEGPVQSESGASVTFRLTDTEETRKIWDFSFVLDYKVSLEGSCLQLSLDLKNTGDKEISFTTALHTYYKVDNVESARIVGLSGLNYVDKCLPDAPTLKEEREEVGLSESADRVYRGPVSSLLVKGAGGGSVAITSTNLPDTVVWNPWQEKAAAMSDLGAEAWPNFICVEGGQCVDPILVGAGQSWSASHSLQFNL